jgi:hypothetical protein
MCRSTDPSPAPVPQGARQAGEAHARWAFAEPTVWTDRMLRALEIGVKGGKWFSLIDKVPRVSNLRAAFARVKLASYANGVSAKDVAGDAIINAGQMPSLPTMGCSP